MNNNNKTFKAIKGFWFDPDNYSEYNPSYIANVSYDVDFECLHGIEDPIHDLTEVLIVRPIVDGFFYRRTDRINNIWEEDPLSF